MTTHSMDPESIKQLDKYITENRPAVLGIGISLGLIATTLVALRLVAYFMVVHKGGRPLIAACISWSIGTPSTIIYIYSTFYPIVFLALTLPKIAAAMGAISIGFAKIGITLFILEVQGPAYRFGKWFLISALVLNFLSYLVMVPFLFLQCGASLDVTSGHCKGRWRADFWFVWTGYWSAATDIILALYPSIIIWNLQMRRKVKILTSCLMGLGIIGAACGICKALEVKQLHGSSTMYSPDRIIPLVLLNTTEMWLVQIASAAAPLWPLVTRASEKWKSSRSYSSIASRMPFKRDMNSGSTIPETRISAPIQYHRDGSRDDMSSLPRGIWMTRHLSVHHEQV